MKGKRGATETYLRLAFGSEEGFLKRKRMQEGGYAECGSKKSRCWQDR